MVIWRRGIVVIMTIIKFFDLKTNKFPFFFLTDAIQCFFNRIFEIQNDFYIVNKHLKIFRLYFCVLRVLGKRFHVEFSLKIARWRGFMRCVKSISSCYLLTFICLQAEVLPFSPGKSRERDCLEWIKSSRILRGVISFLGSPLPHNDSLL